MRFKLFSAFALLLFVGSNVARPSKIASPDIVEEESLVATGSKDDSSLRPFELRSSSVVRNDSRYRSRKEKIQEFHDKQYRGSFTPGILKSFKNHENFRLLDDWKLLSPSNKFVNDSIDSLGFSIMKSEPKLLDRNTVQTNLWQNNNEKFAKVQSKRPEIVDREKLSSSDIQLDDYHSSKAIETFNNARSVNRKNSSLVLMTKNRVAIKPSSYNNTSRYEMNLQPVSLVNDRINTTKHEFKNWPNEAIRDVQDLLNYEKYTSSIENISEQSPVLNYGDAPIYSVTKNKKKNEQKKKKKKKKKKPMEQSFKPGTNYNNQHPASNYNKGIFVTHHDLSTVTSESHDSSPIYNREPTTQPNIQEIIQWLQVPAFTMIPSQSHLAHGVLSGEPIRNSFDHNNHDLHIIRPIKPSGNDYESQNNYPDTSDTTQSHVDDNPIGNHYHQHKPSENLNNQLNNHNSLSENSYNRLNNHDKNQSSENAKKPLTSTLENYHEPQNNYYDTLVTTQSYVEVKPIENNNYQHMSSHESSQSLNNHYTTSVKPTEHLDNHYLLSEKPSENLENDYQKPDNDYHSTQNFYPPENSNNPTIETVRPLETVSLPTSVVNLLVDLVNKKPNSHRRPIFKPSSDITQNTVVHILNPGSKKPNVTVSEMNFSQVEKPSTLSENNSTVGAPPNVHIMFMNEDIPNSVKPVEETMPDSAFQNTNCPTIMINSITRVNNTIESKEGCTDLNIVINSQVLSTNIFKPEDLNEFNDNIEDKYVGNVFTDSSQDYSNDHSLNIQNPDSGITSGSNNASDFGEAERDPDRNDGSNAELVEDEAGETFAANSEVVSESQIIVNTGDAEETFFDAFGGGIEEETVAAPAGGSVVDTVAGIAPEIGSASVIDPGAAVGQALGGPVVSGTSSDTQFPSVSGISGIVSQASGLPGSLGASQNGNGGNIVGSSDSTALATTNDDDNDDDDYDMSPSGLMESMASVFTYFTFLNPLNYSIFSLAAAPFAAMAAGVIGIAAIFFPWALPGVLDLGRAADKVTIRFKPSLHEVVKQSMYKYRDWNHRKSKRRKRKR